MKQEPAERKISQDDLVIPRKMYIEGLKSAKKELKGQTVWMQAGYQLEYYPDRGGSPVFDRKMGPLPISAKISNLSHPSPLVIPRACDFIGFSKKPILKTKPLGASKSAKNQ